MTLIAVKREVTIAPYGPDSSVERMSSYETGDKSLYVFISLQKAETTCEGFNDEKIYDTHGRVYSHRLSYLSIKVRKGGDFFYGNSGNENHT